MGDRKEPWARASENAKDVEARLKPSSCVTGKKKTVKP
jgi:hypothetical protein